MDNSVLDNLLSDADIELKKLRETAWKYKIAFIGLVVIGVSSACFKILYWLRREELTPEQTLLAWLIAVLILTLPLALSPLYSFLPQKYIDSINNVIKKKVIFNELHNYDSEFEIHPNTALPEGLLSRIGIINDSINFGYGDDFFIGEFNGVETKISEYHVTNFMRNVFNGYVAVIYTNDPDGDWLTVNDNFLKFCKKNVQLKKDTAYENLIHENPDIAFIKHFNGKIYIGVKGNKKMFEYSFGDISRNYDKYHSDLTALRVLLNAIDVLTNEKLSHRN